MSEKRTITISLEMGTKLMNYLVQRPYREVNSLLSELIIELNSKQGSTTEDIVKAYERVEDGK